MEALSLGSGMLRMLLSGGGASSGSTFCLDKNVTYEHRVDNVEGWNWCLIPNGGYDAVFFAGMAIVVMCLASPRWDALIVLFFGGIYFTFSYYWNLEHVSNAVMLWLGMRPADIFVYVFLPPFLLDLSVRIDFFMLKKVAFNIAFMAFVMVAASALLLIPFMLYALDLKASGWTAGYVALFGAMIASTDAASVSAVLRSGGGPEILSVLLEGESLFNDASSLTLFEVFMEVVISDEHSTLGEDLTNIVVKTIWSAFVGICIGLAMGIFTRWIYAWLQYRNMEAMAEVAWSVGGAYLSFYITQVWCKGSGCIGAVAFGLYGSSTLLWGMSTKARLSGIFSQFWSVLIFIINGLIFFYVGASSVNFTIRSAQTLFSENGGIDLVKILLYKLPLIYLASFSLRFIMIFISFKLLQLVHLSEGLTIQEVIFVTVGGLRGSLSLVLAQSAATMASSHSSGDETDDTVRRVKAEIAIYTAGYVIMTLLINAPLCGPLLTMLGLDRVRQEQLAMRGEVKNLFRKFTSTAIEDLAAGQDEDELLQGLDWAMLTTHTNFDKQLDKELPEVQPRVRWCHSLCTAYWRLVTAPARLVRKLRDARSSDSTAGDSVDMDARVEAANQQRRQDAELKRATNFNLRDLQRAESRAPASGLTTPGVGTPGSRCPTALVIRDHTASAPGSLGVGGRTLTTSVSTVPDRSRRGGTSGGMLSTGGSLRRSNSRRVSTHIVGGTNGGPGGNPDTAVMDKSFRRGNSRFLEGAVAGPATARSTTPTGMAAALATVGGGSLSKAPSSSAAAHRMHSEAEASDSCIQLTLPPPEVQQQRMRCGNQAGDAAAAAAASGGDDGLFDSTLLALTSGADPPEGAGGGAASGSTAPASAEPRKSPVPLRVAVSLQAAAAATAPSASSLGSIARRTSATGGGDALIEAALAAAAADEGAAAADTNAAEAAESDAMAGPATSVSLPPPPSQPQRLPSSAGPQSPVLSSRISRPSPLSRGTTANVGITGTGQSAPLSHFHASASTGSLQDHANAAAAATTAAAAVVPRASHAGETSGVVVGMEDEPPPEPAALEGAGSAPEPEQSRPRAASGVLSSAGSGGAAGGARAGLLQSLLVIKPGAAPARSAAMNPMTAGLLTSNSVRLVQRLGDDGAHGSGLQPLKTEATVAPGRGLGRSSVRANNNMPMQAVLELPAQPSVSKFDGVGSVTTLSSAVAEDLPLGRGSLSALNAGRPLGRSSAVLAGNADMRSSMGQAFEPPSLSPFEFALPEDVNASLADPFHHHKDAQARATGVGDVSDFGSGLARGSIRAAAAGAATDGAAGGGGLARSSLRQSTAGGGGLGRASMRLGRQAGLAAASAQLARIYDAEITSPNGPGALAGGSPAGLPTDASPIGRPGGLLDSPATAAQRLFPGGVSATIAAADSRPLGSPSRAPGTPSLPPMNQHIMNQVALLQQREAAPQQQAGQTSLESTTGGASSHHRQYSLGTMSKGVLHSLIRRSVSHHPGGGTGGAGDTKASPVRESSGRGSEGLARRTRFAEGATAAALAKASVSGTLRPQSSTDVEGASGGVCAPLLVEYRLRLLAGLKQYYRQKHAAGSLSPSSYKVLSYVADQSAHHPEHPLSLWSMVRMEVSSGPLLQAEASLYFKLKSWTGAARRSANQLVRRVVPRLLVPFVWMVSFHISATTLRGLETAVELWASLTQSLQTEWLQYSGLYGELLLEEVQHEADGAWAYIIERRIEAPNKFGAVQTHRAVIDVLTQQQAFVREMNEGGMIDESECRKIVEVVERRLQMLARRGPRWRQPTVMEILAGTAILRNLPHKVVDWIRKNSTFRLYQQGAAIWDMGRKRAGADPDGLIIVIRGVVRMMLEQDGMLVPYYLGAGGVGGLVSCVLEGHVPGMSSAAAYAEGNALGKGPVVMHIPWSVLQVLRRFSREEKVAPYQALDLQLYRTAAVYVLDLLRHQVTQQFSAFIRTSLLTILSSERLDGPTVRRQRIRLLLQPAASDHHVDGGIDWIGELMDLDLDTATLLLDPFAAATATGPAAYPPTAGPTPFAFSAASALALAPGHHANGSLNCNGSGALMQQHAQSAAAMALQRLAAAPWVETMYKAIAAATGAVLDIIRTSLKDAMLVVMTPGQGIVQRTTMVLIQGTLEPAPIEDADGTGGAANVGGPFVASSNEGHVAPSVMVWVSDYFEGELVAQREVEVVAGPRGATVLLWGMRPEDLLTHSPVAAAAAEMEKAAAAAGSAGSAQPQLSVVPEGKSTEVSGNGAEPGRKTGGALKAVRSARASGLAAAAAVGNGFKTATSGLKASSSGGTLKTTSSGPKGPAGFPAADK